MHHNGTGMRKGSRSFGGLHMLGSERKSAHSPGRARIKNVTLSRSGVDNYWRRGDAPNFPEMINIDNFLMGAEQADLSHAGGELGSLEEDIEEDLVAEDHRRGSKREDWQTHRDRMEIRNRVFASQMPDMVSAYIHMCAEQEMPSRPRSENTRMDEVYEIQVVDMFRRNEQRQCDAGFSGQGYSASLAFGSTGAMCPLEANGSNQGPDESDRFGNPYGSNSSATYLLNIRSIFRSTKTSHFLECKSLCDLHGVAFRPYLCQQFTVAYDLYLEMRCQTDKQVMRALGRDSSWRLKHACPACTYKLTGEDALIFDMLVTMDGNDSLKQSHERVDNRDAGDGCYTSRQRVERWVRDRVADRLPMQSEEPLTTVDRAKYPLAIMEELLDTFGMKLGIGYDVGCHFGTTVSNSELGDRACEKGLKCLVGSFHGHAHNRLCQLQFLATYVEGMGAGGPQGVGAFFLTLQQSCEVLSLHEQVPPPAGNHNALGILKTEGALWAWMQQEKIDSVDRSHEWLVEEKMYLQVLKNTGKTSKETLEMEARYKVAALEARWAREGDRTFTPGVSKEDRARRRAQEKMEKEEEHVEELEEMLDIGRRSRPSGPQRWMGSRSRTDKNESVPDGMEKNLSSEEGKTEDVVELDKQMAVQCFTKLAQTPGFTGTLQCGVALEHDERSCVRSSPRGGEDEWVDEEELERQELRERLRGLRAEALADGAEEQMEVEDEGEADVVGEDDEGHKAREEAVAGLLYQISMLAMDDGVRGDK
ncbi:hypothetical protein DFH08DRAFT_1030550 [Mycena albidolilacea]|uniref:Uncharacterized protein n=1 Tax=Mycena albidolilacea TaxID=1033008 RepID=A0AAD6ZGP8_9AGAR|nr:hypothetical protein DFH08DRAFT_1030550 [Mycena albidolilacea]